MNLTDSRSFFRILIYFIGFLIIGGSLFYSNYLANQLEEKERLTIDLKVRAIDIQDAEIDYNNMSDFEQEAQTFIFDMIKAEDDEVPWILTDANFVYNSGRNLGIPDTLSLEEQQKLAEKQISRFRAEHDPIRIEAGNGVVQYVLYGDSWLLKQLRVFPVAQLLAAIFFIVIVLIGFVIAKRNEQNKVWVGLAKETAHQLGTPVSSLMAWIELLKLNLEGQNEELSYVLEMEHDVKRLEDITERFSKIGSAPELLEVSVAKVLDRSANYLKKRMTRKGNVSLEVENLLPPDRKLNINPQLFNWVIENLLKNALDAIQSQQGKITIRAEETPSSYTIDVSDTGKGIPKSNFNKVFEPGFTTKKRGWGLGLSLTRRIVENYHKGKIFVKYSELGEGTTFRIILPKKRGKKK
jgi:two-component system, sporulation sensor kinase E